MKLNSPSRWLFPTALACAIAASGCIKSQPAAPANGAPSNGPATSKGDGKAGTPTDNAKPVSAKLEGTIKIEGSSTVFPISQAMSREFEKLHPDVQVPVAGNGTGTGFKKFLTREVEICDASRSIKESEIEKCKAAGIEYVELQIALDGLTVVVNKDNDWLDSISIADLKKIWDQDSTVSKWSDVNPEWPDHEIKLFGAGPESGTFEYFTEAVNGQPRRSRKEYSRSENDNILVTGVTGNKYAMGYFGFAYYITSADALKALKIIPEGATEGVAPSRESVEDGTYTPLSRPLFIYVNKEALARPEVAAFVTFYLSAEGQEIVGKRDSIRLNVEKLTEMRQRLAEAVGTK